MRINLLLSILMLFLFISCDKDDDPVAEDPILTVSPDKINFGSKGGSATIKVTMNGNSWTAASNEDWYTVSISSSSEPTDQLTVSVTENKGADDRTAEITFSMDGKLKKTVTVLQAGQEKEEEEPQGIYPEYGNYIEPDATGMSSNAVELAAKINLGFNIGNTLEAIGGETAWGNPKITKEFVEEVKNLGFNAIRLPASWNQYSDPETAEIDEVWLDRVKEVVQYCVDNDMYVLLNIHWDGGWLENNVTPAKKESVNAKQKAFWQQIATHLRDFDEHLMFASTNEPNVDNASQMAVLNSYHQTFVDAVRATGGRNSYRVLVVQGPFTDIEKTNNLMTSLPVDEVPDRMMVEIHTYTPYQFTLLDKDESWGKMFYYWGNGYHSDIEPDRNATWGEEDFLIEQFQALKSNFVDKGIPVLLGEYLAIRRPNVADPAANNASRLHWIKFVTQLSKENGVLPFVWDTGGLIDRNNNNVKDQEALDALLEGGA